LVQSDAAALGIFLGSLSEQTRQRWQIAGYDDATARQICAEIGHYDKLNLVAVGRGDTIIGLIELDFRIMDNEHDRFRGYGIELDDTMDCRFAPCVADRWQAMGVATSLMPKTDEVALRTGRRRMLLSGGTYADNDPAIAFYTARGFCEVGRFSSSKGRECIDMIRAVPATELA
jgi:GNAT superfamily N-acetyltransferase